MINYNVPQIFDVKTLRAAREDDLKSCGLKVGEIIKLRTLVSSVDERSSSPDKDTSTGCLSLERSSLNSQLSEGVAGHAKVLLVVLHMQTPVHCFNLS